MNKIKLSVCVVSYNHEKFIEECLEHILAQKTNFSIEILVGDDCSTDNTTEIVQQKYGDKVILIKRETNVGLCNNMYDLFMRTKGQYIYLINGDDYLFSDEVFQKQVDFLETHEEYFSVTARDYIYKPADGSMGKCETPTGDFTIHDFLKNGLAPCGYGTMRNVFVQEQKQNSFLKEGSRNNEELTMWMYTMDKGKKYIFPEYMTVYRYMTEDASNYNTRYSFLEMFEHYYEDFKVIDSIYGEKYDLIPLKLRLCNRFCLKIGDSIGHFIDFMKVLNLKDKLEFICYKIYLKIHHYQEPKKWDKENYLNER